MILDTNALSALFEGDPLLEKLLCRADKHHLPVIVLGDLEIVSRDVHFDHVKGIRREEW